MVRVLEYGLSSNPGGIETVALKINRAINTKEVKISYLVAGDKLAYETEFKKLGATIYKIPFIRRSPILRIKTFYKFFKEHGGEFDVLHCSYCALYSIEPILFAWYFKIPKIIIHSRQGSHIVNSKFNTIRHFINRKLIDYFATDFISCSELAARFMFSRTRIKKHGYEVIYNPANIDEYKFSSEKRTEIRKKLDIGDNFLIGHIGVFLPFKNHKFIVDIFNQFVKQHNNSKLLLIGGGEEIAVNEIKKLIKEKGLEDKVIFTGKVNNVSDYLSAMDCFLFPSINEGFPNVVVEAQTAGLHCLLSKNITNEISFIPGKVKFLKLTAQVDEWVNELLKYTVPYKREIDMQYVEKLSVDQIAKEYEMIFRG